LLTTADVQNKGFVITLQDNDDTVLNNCSQDASRCTATNDAGFGLGVNSQPITITEQGPNSGVFGTYDESDVSVIKVTDDAKRGTSATIDYNETPATVLVGFDFATIDIQPIDDEWNSGEEIPVVLVDGDANKNSRADEDLDLFDTNVSLIPALQTGDPFTLGEVGTESSTVMQAVFTNFTTEDLTAGNVWTQSNAGSELDNRNFQNVTTTVNVEKFSQRAIIQNSTSLGKLAGGDAIVNATVIDLETTIAELRKINSKHQ